MIELVNGLAVTADQYAYCVGRSATRLRGGVEETRLNNPRYYGTLAKAVHGAIAQAMREKVAAEEITTLCDFLAEYRRISETVAGKLEDVKA